MSALKDWAADMNGEDWFNFIVLVAMALSVVLGTCAIATDHKVRCYYPSIKSTNAGIAYTAKADVNWDIDTIAFSSTNPAETMSFLSSVKECSTTEI